MGNKVDDFLKHRTSDRGGGAFLKGWKEKGKVNVWLHMQHTPLAIWQHGLPRIHIQEDKDTKEATRRVFSGRLNCWESEAVLKKQYKRDKDSGLRDIDPRSCGVCKLLEWMHQGILKGKLPIETPVFQFDADDPKESVTLHAGGMCNMLKPDKLTDKEKIALKKGGVFMKDAWKENAMSKASYIMVVVNHDAVDDGLLIATESASLGDAMKDVISDAMEAAESANKPRDQGDPFENPFLFQWVFDEEAEMSKMYRARRLETKITPEIMELISGESLDLSSQTAPFVKKTVRGSLEKACLLKGKDAPPWDEFFSEEEEPAQRVAKPTQKKAEPVPEPDNTYLCEVCNEEGTDPNKCVKCGTTYDDCGKILKRGGEPPPPAKTTRSRSAAATQSKEDGDIPF